LNKLDEAIADHSHAIELAPNFFGFYNNRGNTLFAASDFAKALSDYDVAIRLNPQFADAYCGRGNVLFELKRRDDAIAAYDKALSIKPDLNNAWLGRGNVFFDLKRYDEAFAAYDKALLIKPDLDNAWLGRGNVFLDLKRYDEAFAAYDRALSINPGMAIAWFNRGNVLINLKRYDEAFAAYDKTFSIKSDLEGAEGARLHSKMCACNWTRFDAEFEHLEDSVRASKPNTDPFSLLALCDSPADHLQCARIWVLKKHPPSQVPMWHGQIYVHDKIRVAYVSADFQEHATAYLLAETLELHDRTKFDVIALSLGPDDKSPMR
jgi:tetratricopeptide (TPR) repeat protein